jgi:hypothetical protein
MKFAGLTYSNSTCVMEKLALSPRKSPEGRKPTTAELSLILELGWSAVP